MLTSFPVGDCLKTHCSSVDFRVMTVHSLVTAGCHWLSTESESESNVTTDGQPASLSWSKAPHLGLTTRSLLHVWQLRSWSCGAPSLTRGRVCPLYMLLDLASAVFLGSESLRTWDHILLSQIRDFPFRRLLRLAGVEAGSNTSTKEL
jgi:hypothetical protein